MSVLTALIKKLTSKHLAKSIASKSRNGKKSKKINRKKGKELNQEIRKETLRAELSGKSKRKVFGRNEEVHEGKKQAADAVKDASQKIEGQRVMKQIAERERGRR
jgi:hypothetical protein